MSRPIRIQYPGASYHVMSRGNCGNKIFKDRKDYENFLIVLTEAKERYGLLCYAYCLMPNHYHLFLETPDPNLSIAMQHLNGRYTQKYNIRHKQFGHVFQGRYKSVLVEKDLYKYELIRYIALNPVRADLVKRPGEWEWSSHNEMIGKLGTASGCIDADTALAFYDDDKDVARKNYLENIRLRMDGEFIEKIEKSILLGGENFSKSIEGHFKAQAKNNEIPKLERFACRPSLETLFLAKDIDKKRRNELMKSSFFEHGYSLSRISKATGLHYTTISRIINELEM